MIRWVDIFFGVKMIVYVFFWLFSFNYYVLGVVVVFMYKYIGGFFLFVLGWKKIFVVFWFGGMFIFVKIWYVLFYGCIVFEWVIVGLKFWV